MPPVVIRDWTTGRTRSREPGFVPPEPETVTVVPRGEALREFGCRDERELRRYLRVLRDLGVLVVPESGGRLTMRVRTGPAGESIPGPRARAYVVRGEQVPRKRQRGASVLSWS